MDKSSKQSSAATRGDATIESVSWPDEQVLPSLPSPDHLDVIDVRDSSPADRLLLTTLQGAINRSQPRLYLVDDSAEGPLTWLPDLGVDYTFREHLESIIDAYIEEISQIIVYDSSLPDTINTATTMAAVEGGVIAHPDRAESLGQSHPHLEIRDLRDRFETADEATRWQFEEYWDETTDRLLFGLPPTEDSEISSRNRDYAIATGAMTISQELDKDLLETIVGSIEPHGTYMGWFGGLEGEFDGVKQCSENAVSVAPSDHYDNLTVFAGIDKTAETSSRHLQGSATPDPENKVYVTLTYTEGDNLQYNQHRMRELWDDDGRGRVPINWSTTPLLIDVAPTILEFYQATATPNDHLMCGPSGVGYMYPYNWPEDELPAFADRTARYMSEAELDTMYLLNRDGETDLKLADETVEVYGEKIDPLGAVYNFWSGKPTTNEFDDDLPRSIGPFVEDGAELFSEIYANTPDNWDGEEPAFLTIGLLAWDITPTEVADAIEQLEPEYEVVRGDVFFELFRETRE